MDNEKRVIALGFFDGVHIGHGELLRTCTRRAAEYGVTPSVISFDSLPTKAVKGLGTRLIQTVDDRLCTMDRLYGIKDVVHLCFDDNLRTMPWDEFVVMLKRDYNAVHLVAGYDFKFGYKCEGTTDKLRALCAELGMGCDIVNCVTIDGEVVSSSAIRGFLAEGNLEKATRFLGHNYVLTGPVVHGYQVGRTIGIPTANLHYPPDLITVCNGVYITDVTVPDCGKPMRAVTNIGVRPTLGGDTVTVETHIPDFSGDLYWKKIRIEFLKYLRPEKAFPGLDALKEQIQLDIKTALEYRQ